MISQRLFLIILGLIIGAWFLIGEKKTFGEKVGTLLFFGAMYLAYQALNTEHAADFLTQLKYKLGMY